LSRYAGDDEVSIFGIFNHNNSRQKCLIAQIIWYFIEGFHYRSNEYPFGVEKLYKIYRAYGSIFHKSDKTDRWWIEIHLFQMVIKTKRNTLLPCSYDEYLGACNQELPERWWKAQRKVI
jgi:hypothetical protein